MEIFKRPPPPYRSSQRADTCTKSQGSSLRSPEDHGVPESVNRKDPLERASRRGETEAGRESRGEGRCGTPSTKTERR